MWQLQAYIRGRLKSLWEPFSNFMALMHNINSKNSKQASAFNPFADQKGIDKGCVDAYLK